ncbi:VWA domain-containing protein [Streptomyces sp. ISL-96]|uniref:vWA domain-containing protein n=1 Tax=Streptomyces sp. ISL-96 TaxID=2819191 RepID=UPI001BE56236|nr:vWA domain-containing protein [Streptomyces sp. ISL-96]MBT2489098.1 VWA domain-containing protein [Streptomyces sp. ISL-96]
MAQDGTEDAADARDLEDAAPTGGAGAVFLEVSQQPYISVERGAEGGTRMCAVVTVTVDLAAAREGAAAPAPLSRAEVLLLDCSASMGYPREKLWAAQDAATEAVRALPDGTYFAIVAGRHTAELVYPTGSGPSATTLVRADATTRKEAEDAIARLVPSGGTAIGSWLALARELFGPRPAATIRHALLLSDGRNEHEQRAALAAEVTACQGLFTCDALGIGEDWDPDELQLVAGGLDGKADAVRDLDALPGEFRAVTAESVGRRLTGLRLRLTHRAGSGPLTVQQVHPTRRDLLPDRVTISDRCLEFRTPPWGDETREYLVCVAASRTPQEPVDRALWLADLKVVREVRDEEESIAPQLPPARALVVHWTRHRDLYSTYDPKVEHYAHHDALVRGLEEGRAAQRAGDPVRARAAWGEAVRRAHAMGNEPMLQRLGDVVRIIDAAAGEVEIRPDIRPLDINSAMVLRAHSTMLPPQKKRTQHKPQDPECR